MQIYISDSEISALASLEPRQRRLAKNLAMEALRDIHPWIARLPVLLCSLGAALGWAVSPFVAWILHHPDVRSEQDLPVLLFWSYSVVFSLLGGATGGFIGNQF